MLDRKFIVENASLIQENCARRGVKCDVARLVQLETARRQKLQEVEELNRQANETQKKIGQTKDPAERETVKAAGRQLREAKDAAQAEHDRLDTQVHALQQAIPNLTHPAAPIGGEADSKDIRRGKTPIRTFDFTPLDHVAIGERLGLFDLEAGARTTGHGFYFLKNDGVLLDLALQRYAIETLIREGFMLTTTPDLARNEILEGIGFNPRGSETQVYSIENTDLSLVGTAEITLGGMYSGLTLEEEQLPIKVAGLSHCFRTEAGAHGQATRGIYRVHQFTKVEMFAYTTPEASDAMHDAIMAIECQIFDGLGIPYRVIDTASGDLGGPAYRKFDLEAWMPGRGTVKDGKPSGDWGEITSTSNCTDYQSRRLNTRFRKKGEKGTQFVHTLNGTAVANTRAMIAILENYQQADGSVTVPEVLRTWMGKDRIAAPA
ncbi:MAG: serine--tRNA ligase [Pirellulaceae bacterium]|jgi:seryl-tRNA synthetase|nr:serine--tRNA ligase [Pirellulaceae bacterium]